jgi:hypothetical protein
MSLGIEEPLVSAYLFGRLLTKLWATYIEEPLVSAYLFGRLLTKLWATYIEEPLVSASDQALGCSILTLCLEAFWSLFINFGVIVALPDLEHWHWG